MEGEARAVERARQAEASAGRGAASKTAGAAGKPEGPGKVEPHSLCAGPGAPAAQPGPPQRAL